MTGTPGLADLELALQMADVADRISSTHFGGPVEVEAKPDGTPVTAVDREVEDHLLGLVQRERSRDGFLGEESGATEGTSGRRWIVDGIDGTHNFAAGSPEWGTLVALEDAGEIVVGVVTAPALGRRWWAQRGGGSWTAARDPSAAPRRIGPVSTTARLADAHLLVLPPPEVRAVRVGWRGAVAEHMEAAGSTGRPTVNGHVPLLVAAGRVDASVHVWGGPWDHAALVPIVEEAGGRFSDLWGGRRLDTETAIFTNGVLHDQVLARAASLRPEMTC